MFNDLVATPNNSLSLSVSLSLFVCAQFSVTVTRSFIDYTTTQPLLFEVLGHYHHHPLHGQATPIDGVLTRSQPPTPPRYLPSPHMSKPIPSKTLQSWKSAATSHVRAQHDLLVWFEICELEASGEYIAVAVDHSDDVACAGKFLLHQGVQRRIAVTICHEDSSEVAWKEVKEIVIGRVRGHRDHESSCNDQNVLTLNLISAHYTQKARDDQR